MVAGECRRYRKRCMYENISVAAHHVSVSVCVTRLLWRSQQWYKTSKQPVFLQLQHSQLIVSLNLIAVDFVKRQLPVVHTCQHITQVSQALPDIRTATWWKEEATSGDERWVFYKWSTSRGNWLTCLQHIKQRTYYCRHPWLFQS